MFDILKLLAISDTFLFCVFFVILPPVIVAAIVIPRIIIDTRKRKNTEIVLANSEKIKRVKQLNTEITFHNINPHIVITKRYDNKINFNRIQPAYVLSGEMRNHADDYRQFIAKTKENREKEKLYSQKLNEILSVSYCVNYEQLGISKENFVKYEKELLQTVFPNTNTAGTVTVNMYYSSPKGRVNLHKSGVFKFESVVAAFDSISYTRMDENTYKMVSAYERGEVSDSLRYDIMRRDNFKCVICGVSANDGARLHIDHIVPIAKGGKSVPSNLRTLCERCNIGKSDKLETSPNTNLQKGSKDIYCERCGAPLILRAGSYGEFWGCSNYPKCRYTKQK